MDDNKRVCAPCKGNLRGTLPPCPLKCGSKKCKAYRDKAPLDFSNKPIVWVLGGPGSGKGTQCERIVAKYGFTHLSTGDLLRAEVGSGSERAKCLSSIMEKGGLVPNDIVLELLKEAMAKKFDESKGFLIDGYPREKDQGVAFERVIAPVTVLRCLTGMNLARPSTLAPSRRMIPRAGVRRAGLKRIPVELVLGCPFETHSINVVILYFKASCETLVKRLLGRAASSGRADDNEETIKLRINTFLANNDQVLALYPCKLQTIDAETDVETIFKQVEAILDPLVKARKLLRLYHPLVYEDTIRRHKSLYIKLQICAAHCFSVDKLFHHKRKPSYDAIDIAGTGDCPSSRLVDDCRVTFPHFEPSVGSQHTPIAPERSELSCLLPRLQLCLRSPNPATMLSEAHTQASVSLGVSIWVAALQTAALSHQPNARL
ncbi:Adenylate kinase isoenzyme 1 [Eumeta japonica]|uniref:Adenylate kinase isoenzyme 1 n=1 Tax=Eumeta variegata TaxID=151549 RepID=A0A4C1ZTZ1_EUMVA|nr:Adenylate kinase isoenzyme 1 [Eumeta japonica]